jgi:ribosomal protein S18 acetylase RimI-like enzyme
VPLGEERRNAVGALLGRAFQDDPIFVHACPDPDERARWLPAMFRWSAWRGFLSGRTLGTIGPLQGVAVATRSDADDFTEDARVRGESERARQAAGTELWDRAGASLMAALAPAEEALHHAVPEPQWYIDVIAVDPAVQGQGIGSTLLHAVEALADADGVPVTLLITHPALLGFYERHGYEVVFQAPGPEGVHWQGMRRDPSRAR